MFKSILPRFLFISVLLLIWSPGQTSIRVHFIDVGHGDAILIEEEGQGVALVDAGKPEAGMIVLNYIHALDITRIEHLFVTHDHDDHVGGIPLIIDSLDIGVVYHTGMVHGWEEAQRFQYILEEGIVPSKIAGAGDIPVREGEIEIRVLSPQREETEGKNPDPNSHSMVLLVRHESVNILLAADIYREQEKWLTEQYGDQLQSQVLKVPHHGSEYASSAEFLAVVQPDVAIITVGPNELDYPSFQTIERLKQYCQTVFRTDMDGNIVIESDGVDIEIIQPQEDR